MRLVRAGGRILFSRVGQVLANAFVVMVVASTLGPTGQGHYSLTVAVAMLLGSLLGGGMGLAAVPPLRQDRVPARRMLTAQLIWAAAMVCFMGMLAFLTLTGNTAKFFADHLGWFPGVGFAAMVAAASILGFEIFSYDLLARGRLVISAAVNGVRAMAHLLVVVVLWFMGELTFGKAVGAFALAQLMGAVVVLVILLRDIHRRPHPEPVGGDSNSGELPENLGRRSLGGLILFNLRHGWLGQISAVAYFLLLRLDQGLLEHFRGAAEVGIYSVAVYVGEMLWLLPGALTPLLVHSSARHQGDPDRDRTAARALRIGFLLTLVAGAPLFFLAKPLLGFLAGGEYQASGDSLRALLPGIIIFAPGAVLAGDFIGRGKPHWNTQASALTVAVNLVAAYYLIPRHGAVGAAWSSSIAYTVGSAMMLMRFRQATGFTWGKVFFGRRRAWARQIKRNNTR
jgi:O-antigen/teichoic acid export membrane protein